MATHQETGKTGEELAVVWLQSQHFNILHRNWRYSHYEIDIIARKEKYLCFIEVKTRHQSGVGFPEDAVSKRKFRNLRKAADQYLYLNPGHPWIQFHILAITFNKHAPTDYFLIEDVSL